MIKTMIFGGAGFIGSHVVEALHKHDQQLFIFDDLSTGRLENIRHLISTKHNTRIKFELSDVKNWSHVEDAFDRFRPDYIIMLASQPRESDPKLDMETTLGGMLNVIRASKLYSARRIIFASSVAVYKEKLWGKLRETDTTSPRSPYGISKLAAENYLRALFPESVVLRLGNVYGQRQSEGLIANIIRHFKFGDEFQIRGDGKYTRDYVFVEDVTEAILCSITGKPGTYNIGSSHRRSVLDVTRALADLYEVPLYLWEHRAQGDPRKDICLDIGRAAEGLNWTPRVDFLKGLRRTRDWWERPQDQPQPVKVPIAYEVVV